MHRCIAAISQFLSHVCRIFRFFSSNTVASHLSTDSALLCSEALLPVQMGIGDCGNCHSWLGFEWFRKWFKAIVTRHQNFYTSIHFSAWMEYSENGNRVAFVSAHMRCTIAKCKIRLKLMCIWEEPPQRFGIEIAILLVQLTSIVASICWLQ